MEFDLVATIAGRSEYELHGALDDGECLSVGNNVSIELMDDTFIEREILALRAFVNGKWSEVAEFNGPGTFVIQVSSLENHFVKTPNEVAWRRFAEKQKTMVCLTPFEELSLGDESIHDWVEAGYKVPSKVIAYLKTTEPFIMSPGIYDHPFKPGERLLGPYCYTDGHFWWDRDCWKYVTRYHVKLPREFVDYVMSGKGDEFLAIHLPWAKSWFDRIEKNYGDIPHGNFLPEDAGNVDIEAF